MNSRMRAVMLDDVSDLQDAGTASPRAGSMHRAGASRRELQVVIVGPLAPPAGGMAGQTRQLCERLRSEGIAARIVQTNRPYRPRFIESVRGIRALVRLVPYVFRLWQAAGRADVFHVMANSGWAWHLFAAPAIWIGKARRLRVVVNYRGGDAEAFLARSMRTVGPSLRMADSVVVPSEFLRGVFARAGVAATVVPNAVDVVHFAPGSARPESGAPHIVVARHLEPIYDIPTAIRAFAELRASFPSARLSVAGSGAERKSLDALVQSLGLRDCVAFCGTLSRERMADLYRSASIVVNASVVDNTPNSLLEAMSSGVPIVSTDVGGIPFLVCHGENALLVPPRDPAAMAAAMRRLLHEPSLVAHLVRNGRLVAERCAWCNVYPLWLREYAPATEALREPTRDGRR